MTVEAYPLQWPPGRPRCEQWQREPARFDVSFTRARDNITREVKLLTDARWHDPQLVISTNVPLRRDGLPLAGQRVPNDPGVAVYFNHKKRSMCFACDRWERIEHNMQAISKTIEALRGIARWGTGDMLEAAFTGFVALPAPGAERQWWEVLGVKPDALIREVEDAYRRLRSERHPDRGGSTASFDEVQKAYERANMFWSQR